jgi:hypothetical protein
MFTSYADRFLYRVRAVAFAAMQNREQQAVQFEKDLISDQYPPASEWWTPPHRRKGYLYEGVQGITIEDMDGIESQIGSSRIEGNPNVPQYLEFGTSRMVARPYASVAKADQGPKFREDVSEALREVTA